MDQYLAEIRMFAGNFAPKGWATCDGQLLPISQNTALFAVIGTYYGGNGTSVFALPDLRNSAPIHQGQGIGLTDRVVGEVVGEPAVTLNQNEMPSHTHPLQARPVVAAVKTADPTQSLAKPDPATNHVYETPLAQTPMTGLDSRAISATGGGQSHNNVQPYLGVTFIIALTGIFPSRN